MFDLTDYTSTELHRVSAPLSVEELTAYFDAKEKATPGERVAFLIDYTSSTLKGKALMTYLSNLEVKAVVVVDPNSPVEERFELLSAYMSSRGIVECPNLAGAAALVLAFTGGDTELHGYLSNPWLTLEEISEFIQNHVEIVSAWAVMMNSMWVFAAENATNKELFENIRPELIEIDDAYFVGKNFVNLFALAPFVETYYSSVPDKMFYFTKQFNDAMFASKKLISWFIMPSNPLLFFMEAHEEISQLWQTSSS